MNTLNKMITAASGAIDYIFNPTPTDKILILTDTYSIRITEAFKTVFNNNGCLVDVYQIRNDQRPIKNIPEELEKLLAGKTIVLNIIRAYPEEIAFRIKWIFKVEENKLIKMGHMPGITEDMMLRSVNVDFYKMKSAADMLIKKLQKAERLHITTQEGTDLFLGVKDRTFIDDVGIAEGGMCNLPCGEIYCAPVETEAEGIIIFDGSIGDIGLLKHPLKVVVQKGKIIKFESEDQRLVKKIIELTTVDEEAKVIGELGIGINAGAIITGNMLEDEKAIGTAHIAFGNNADFPGGGNNHSKIHRDYIFYNPTIKAFYSDGSEQVIMNKGNLIYNT